MTTEQPQYEPGGGKLLLIVALIVGTALAGMAFSFLSRQHAPKEAPAIKTRHLPPSEKPAEPAKAAVPPAPTSVPAK